MPWTWVERVGSKQLEIDKSLDGLRKKEQAQAPSPKKGNGKGKIDLLAKLGVLHKPARTFGLPDRRASRGENPFRETTPEEGETNPFRRGGFPAGVSNLPEINIIPSEQGASERVTPLAFATNKLEVQAGGKLYLDTKARQKAIEAGENFYNSIIYGGKVSVVGFPLTRTSSTGEIEAVNPDTGFFPGEGKPEEYDYMAAMRERFANDPNPIIRFANTPTRLLGFTPADIVGIGLIIQEGISAIRSFTEFRRLPQVRAMEAVAKERNIPRDSPAYQDAQNALKTAFNLHKMGATEAADEIIGQFNKAYAGRTGTPSAVFEMTKAIAPFNPKLAPSFTPGGSAIPGQTRPLADIMAGAKAELVPKVPALTKVLWDATPVAQRVINAQAAGLSGQVGSKAFEALTSAERTALEKITAPVTQEVTGEYKILQLNRKGSGVDNPQDIKLAPPVNKLSDSDLWAIVQTPLNKSASPEVTSYFAMARREFDSRDIKLKPIISAVPEVTPVTPEVTKTFPLVVQNHIADKINTKSGLAARLATFTDNKYADLVKKNKDELQAIWDKEFPSNRGMAISLISEAYRQSKGEKPATPAGAEARAKAEGIPISEEIAAEKGTAIPQLDALIYSVKQLPDKTWQVEIGLYESLGEAGGEILTKDFTYKPTITELEEITDDSLRDSLRELIQKEKGIGFAPGALSSIEESQLEVLRRLYPETETGGGVVPPSPPPVPIEAGGEGGLRPPLTTLPPEPLPAVTAERQAQKVAPGKAGVPPTSPITASGIPNPPPSITPGPMAQNVIGLRAIQPGLTRQQTINNWIRRQFGKAYKKIGGHELVLEDALATPAIMERARVAPIIESQANDLAAKIKVKIAQTFKLDKQGRVLALADVIPDIGAPTIQDIAARLPLYSNSLTPQELEVFSFLKESVQPYHDLMVEVGVELRRRADVMEGGFYLPRSFATLEDADLPYKVGGGRAGMKKGFEKPAVFDSMAQGIEAGYKYPSLSDAVANYARGAGQRATDAHVVNYMKALTDDTGNLLGETPKIRMLRQNSGIARPVEEIKANLVRLKSNIGALTQRQMDVIDLWTNDPDFADVSAVIISLQEGLSTMKAGTPPRTLKELRTLLKQNIDALKVLKPSYDKAMRQAQVTPREQGVINVQILPGLQGRTFPVELSNAINIRLNQEGMLTGRGAVAMNITNAFNALWAMAHATADLSASGIQGLLLLYNNPVIFSKAFGLQVKTLFGDKVAGEYLLNFDAREKQAGRLTSAEWNRAGSRMSGEAGFLETIGVSEKIMNLPIIKQSNRAFSLFGDIARKEWDSSELRSEMAKGRTLEEITASGDLERISFASNVMTGWSSEGFGSSIGQTILFAPRWLQSRLSTLTLAAKGLRPGATKDQAMARNAILKLIAFGTLITVALNVAQDEETDFRLIVDGKRNPHFMRVKVKLPSGKVIYISLFGSWDSLVGMLTHIGTGRPLNAIRNMGSGVVAVAFDLITGRDYQWREVGSKPVDPVKLSQWIMRSSVPYAWGDLPETYQLFTEGEVIPGTLRLGGEALGIKSYIEEEAISDEYKKAPSPAKSWTPSKRGLPRRGLPPRRTLPRRKLPR